MRASRHGCLALLVVGLGGCACGDDDSAPGEDAGLPGADAGADGATDAGTQGHDAAPPDPEVVSSITKDGVTWTFAEPATAGQFVTGDWWVVGPVTISAIDPPPGESAPFMNGTVKNLPFERGSGFDQRLDDGVDQSWWFDAALRQIPPIALVSGDTLVSSISYETPHTTPEPFSPWDMHPSPIRSYSVLTVVPAPVSAEAFRPSYCDRGRTYHLGGDVARELLPTLAPPNADAVPSLADFTERYRRPWVDLSQFAWDTPGDYMPGYGHHMSLSNSYAALLLTLDFSPEEKVDLTNFFVQYGIDLYGCVQAGFSYPAFGGHGLGRKLVVIFAGVLLDDAGMKGVSAAVPDSFAEDMQTVYVDRIPGGYTEAWQGARAIYGGHWGVRADGTPVDTTEFNDGSGPYEQLQPRDWPVWSNEQIGEAYRRCCTSTGFVAEALAARLLGPEAVAAWDYPAFFDYADRWMTEDDTAHVAAILEQSGFDYSTDWQRQGQTRQFLAGRIPESSFVDDMWSAYRASH